MNSTVMAPRSPATSDEAMFPSCVPVLLGKVSSCLDALSIRSYLESKSRSSLLSRMSCTYPGVVSTSRSACDSNRRHEHQQRQPKCEHDRQQEGHHCTGASHALALHPAHRWVSRNS